MPYKDRDKRNEYRRLWYLNNAEKERERMRGIRTGIRTELSEKDVRTPDVEIVYEE